MSGIGDCEYNFGPAWVSPPELASTNPSNSIFIEAVDDNRSLLSFFSCWGWLRWVAGGCFLMRVDSVDVESGTVTFASESLR